MDATVDPERPAILGHMNLDFFVKAFRALDWDVTLVEWMPGAEDERTITRRREIIERTRPDVVFWPESARWGPGREPGIKVIFYCNDAHFFNSAGWWKHHADLFIVRHARGVARIREQIGDPQARVFVLPFSVDPELVADHEWSSRRRAVGFSGAADEYLYPGRVAAAAALERSQLLDDHRTRWHDITLDEYHQHTGEEQLRLINHHRKPGGIVRYRQYGHPDPREYFDFLAAHQICLTSCSTQRLVLAKDYEIAACGSVPLTDERSPISAVLPQGTWLTYPAGTAAGVAQIVIKALRDQDELRRMGERARQHVLMHHTDADRIEHLSEILEHL